VEQTPDENRNGHQQHAKDLIAPVYTTLLGAARFLGLLLVERLDAGFNHRGSLGIDSAPEAPAGHASV
jgi:hypothetical protein